MPLWMRDRSSDRFIGRLYSSDFGSIRTIICIYSIVNLALSVIRNGGFPFQLRSPIDY
jgi:hypothetical protein